MSSSLSSGTAISIPYLRARNIKSILGTQYVGRTVDQDIILNLDLDKHEYDLGVARVLTHIYAFEDEQRIPEGHYGRFVELLCPCG